MMSKLSRLGDFFLLNIIYLISCIPVITIGAATTALYYTTLKMAENRESYLWEDYKKSFVQNFKQATIIWAMILAVGGVLAADVLLIKGLSQQFGALVLMIVIVAFIFLTLLCIYVFPVLARFENTVPGIMKCSIVMAIRHLPSTIVIILIHSVPLLLAFVSIEVFLKGGWVILLFAVSILAFAESGFFSRIFANYYPKKEQVEFKTDTRGGYTAWLSRQK